MFLSLADCMPGTRLGALIKYSSFHSHFPSSGRGSRSSQLKRLAYGSLVLLDHSLATGPFVLGLEELVMGWAFCQFL